jgi:hypothetical protein
VLSTDGPAGEAMKMMTKLMGAKTKTTSGRHEAVQQCSFQPEPTFFISAVSLAITSGFTGSVTL